MGRAWLRAPSSLLLPAEQKARTAATGAGAAVYPGRNRLVDIETAVVEVWSEFDSMGQRAGRRCLVQGRFGAQHQSRSSSDYRRAEGSPGSAGVGAAREGADDVFAGGCNPNVRVSVVREGRARVPVRGRSNPHYICIERCGVHGSTCVLVSGSGDQNHALLVGIGNCLTQGS